MAAYYIGRNMDMNVTYKVFHNALLPGLICAVLGLILYVYQPAWYLANIDNPTTLESFRLFFPLPMCSVTCLSFCFLI